MTQTLTAPVTSSRTRLLTSRVASAACGVAGVLLVSDTVVITVLDRSFDPIDSVLFLGGLVVMLVGLVATAVALTAGRRPRWGRALGALVLLVAVLGVVSDLGDRLARAVYTGSNLGLRTEWSFFLVGVQLLVLAVLVARRQQGQLVTTESR
jgi:hypothetical protein